MNEDADTGDDTEDGDEAGGGSVSDIGCRVLSVTIGDNPPPRLDKALARDVPEAAALSRTRLARLIADGAVTAGGTAVTDASARVTAGTVLSITLAPPEDIVARPEAIPLAVVWEDADLIVIDKPAGMVVHPAPGAASGTLVNALLAHCAGSLSGIGGMRRPGIVHRIDKNTTGLIVAAKTDAAHHGLAAQFAAHSVERRYTALLHGHPRGSDPRLAGLRGVAFEPGGTLRIATQLDRHPGDRQRQAVVAAGGRHAVTRMTVARTFGVPPAVTQAECRLETGRTHQIRVHMAHVGHPLVGDPVYGGRRRAPAAALGVAQAAAVDAFPRQALHAATLGFVHPVTGQALSFAAPLPPDMVALIEVLAAAAPGPTQT
jgi:23S rRNA pseudouridine1911/1915/1917 synthase